MAILRPRERSAEQLRPTRHNLTVLTTDFDVAAYTQAEPQPIAVEAPDLVLNPQQVLMLRYLREVLATELDDMRAMLTSWTGHEARITAFLATWAVERYWSTRALRDLLELASAPAAKLPAASRHPVQHRLASAYNARILPLAGSVTGTLVGEPITAGHMARMAVNQALLTTATHSALLQLPTAARTPLQQVCDRQEIAFQFFAAEATARIQRSRAERTSADLHLRWPWRPLLRNGLPIAGETQAITALFGPQEARRHLLRAELSVTQNLRSRRSPATALVRRHVNPHSERAS